MFPKPTPAWSLRLLTLGALAVPSCCHDGITHELLDVGSVELTALWGPARVGLDGFFFSEEEVPLDRSDDLRDVVADPFSAPEQIPTV